MPESAPQAAVTMFKPLRAWIPLLVLPLMIAARFTADVWTDGPSWTWAITAFFPFLFSLTLILWWLLLSRARYTERLLGAARADRNIVSPAVAVARNNARACLHRDDDPLFL